MGPAFICSGTYTVNEVVFVTLSSIYYQARKGLRAAGGAEKDRAGRVLVRYYQQAIIVRPTNKVLSGLPLAFPPTIPNGKVEQTPVTPQEYNAFYRKTPRLVVSNLYSSSAQCRQSVMIYQTLINSQKWIQTLIIEFEIIRKDQAKQKDTRTGCY